VELEFCIYMWMKRLVTSDWGLPASSFSSRYCTWTDTCLCTSRQVSVCIFQCWI